MDDQQLGPQAEHAAARRLRRVEDPDQSPKAGAHLAWSGVGSQQPDDHRRHPEERLEQLVALEPELDEPVLPSTVARSPSSNLSSARGSRCRVRNRVGGSGASSGGVSRATAPSAPRPTLYPGAAGTSRTEKPEVSGATTWRSSRRRSCAVTPRLSSGHACTSTPPASDWGTRTLTPSIFRPVAISRTRWSCSDVTASEKKWSSPL